MAPAVSRVDAPTSSPTRPPYLAITAIFAGIGAALTVVVALVSGSVDRTAPELTGPAWLDGWFQMDSGWYFQIAASGYSYVPGQMSPIAFFPEYPLAVRAVGAVIGDYQLAGTLIGVLCGLASVLLFASWVWPRLPRRAAATAVGVMMLYPYALYLYGSMYADSLFILTAIAAFMLLEHRLYWLAGLAGALATAGRPVGVAVAVGLVVRMLEMRAEARAAHSPPVDADALGSAGASAGAGPGAEGPPGDSPAAGSPAAGTQAGPQVEPQPSDRTGSDRPRYRALFAAIPGVRWREAGVLLSGVGLIAWCLYLWRYYGDPLAFLTVQEAPGWYQGSGPVTWFKVGFARAMLVGPFDVAVRLLPQALMCLLAMLLLHRVWRRFGWGYAAYSLVVLAIPIIGTKDFMGTGRYVLAAFPVLAAAGDFLATRKQKWVRPVVLAVSAVGLVAATVVYASGVEVS